MFRLGRQLSHRFNMKIVPVLVREDNYAYILIDQPSNEAAIVDPFDVPKVTSVATSLGVSVVAGITTHHHFDHSGGNKDFAAKFPGVPIYGGSDQIPALTKLVKDKDEFTLGKNTLIRCLATPCHTQDSICYHATDAIDESQPGAVFTGDTLFIAGCGRFFEGSAEEMDKALTYLGTLPDDTIVHNGHEYTAGNLAFAKSVDPDNEAIQRLADLVKQNNITTGLTTIQDEKQWNPFMRLASDAVRKSTSATADTPLSDIMNSLRNKKNNFRG